MLLFPIIGFMFLAVLLGITFLLYYVPKQLGYHRIGAALSSISLLIIVYFIVIIVFEDEFFTKSDAQKALSEQGIELKDEFELSDNEFQSSIGDYAHTFSVQISENDKQRLIEQIVGSYNYTSLTEPQIDMISMAKREEEGKTVQNYELESAYVREVFTTYREGYSPSQVTIAISKEQRTLTYQLIEE